MFANRTVSESPTPYLQQAARTAGVPADPARPELAALWTDLNLRSSTIAAVQPFRDWPVAALQRLAMAARPAHFAAGAMFFRKGAPSDWVSIVVAGAVESSMSTPDGRRIVLKLDAPGMTYGLVSMIDGGVPTNDMSFLEPGVALRIPNAAIHAELAADPALWEPVARLLNARSRFYIEQIRSFMLDSLPSRAASLLLGLRDPHPRAAPGQVPIGFRLTQERFAEMLGVTRQAVTPLLRTLVRDGLLQWRYGRVTLLDEHRLEALAQAGIQVDARSAALLSPPQGGVSRSSGRRRPAK